MQFSHREMGEPAAPPLATLPLPGPAALFLAFLGIAMQGFGGVLPFARRDLVERRGWMSEADFAETLALCQALPGPNVVNLSIVLGARCAGAQGAIAAVAGLVLAPVAVVIVLGELYARFGAAGRLAAAVAGVGAAAAGLVVATSLKMTAPMVRRRPFSDGSIIVAAFVAVGLLRLPLPWVLVALAPVSLALAWRRRA